MSQAKRIEEVEGQLVEQRTLLTTTSARIRGLEAELEALREGSDAFDLSAAPRTKAIAAVLRESPGTLSPSEILNRFHAAGRTDELRSVTATLDHLVKKGTVKRPSRGQYRAAWSLRDDRQASDATPRLRQRLVPPPPPSRTPRRRSPDPQHGTGKPDSRQGALESSPHRWRQTGQAALGSHDLSRP